MYKKTLNHLNYKVTLILLASIVFTIVMPALLAGGAPSASAAELTHTMEEYPIHYKTVEVDGLDIFYREAGPEDAPVILLLHGFPTSSHMFRNLIPELAGQYRVIAPDYPGFGRSSMPTIDEFEYTFANLADVTDKFVQEIGLEQYSMYLMDYGAPIGFRLATAHPERVEALIVQNGNAYEEGIAHEFFDGSRALWQDPENEEIRAGLIGFLGLEGTKFQYLAGTRNPESIDPVSWIVPQYGLDRPGNQEIQLALFYDYRTNVELYPEWQEYLIENQPPTLVVWGKNDPLFPTAGALPYLRDLETIEFHLLNTGHFALEEDGDIIAELMRTFLAEYVVEAAVE